MKISLFAPIFIFSVLLFSACDKDKDDEIPANECFVQLFDGDDYTDDHFTIREPGDYPDLSNLPGTDKNWDDEADSFKSGSKTTVTFWTEKNFGGDSITYQNGAEMPSIDEPRSMKISCQ